MRHDDKQLGFPDKLYTATKSAIEALTTGTLAGMIAYATNGQLGIRGPSGWIWMPDPNIGLDVRRLWLPATVWMSEQGSPSYEAFSDGLVQSHGALPGWRCADGTDRTVLTSFRMPNDYYPVGGPIGVYYWWAADDGWTTGDYLMGYNHKRISVDEDIWSVFDTWGSAGDALTPTGARLLARRTCTGALSVQLDELMCLRMQSRGSQPGWTADADFWFFGAELTYNCSI